MRPTAATLAALLLAACNGQPAPPPSRPAVASQKAPDEAERGNLLNIAFGASVVSRTAELTLDQSALRAIDGDPESSWDSPPDDARQQTIVFALPTLTLVEKIGIRTPRAPVFRLTEAQMDSSTDGVNFTPLITLKLTSTEDVQLFAVAPREVVYLRLTTLETEGRFAKVQSVQVRGTHKDTPRQQPLDGCWSINGNPATFSTDRGRVTGTIGGKHPVSFDGGTDGLVYRFVWTSGAVFGFGAIDTAPDKNHLSGLRWYTEPIGFSSGESWFGERAKSCPPLNHDDVPAAFLRHGRRFPLYALRFDDRGALIESDSVAGLEFLARLASESTSKRYRFVSREYRMPTPAENGQRARTRLDSLRIAIQKRGVDPARFDWVAAGSDSPPRPIETEIQRVLYGVIELQPL